MRLVRRHRAVSAIYGKRARDVLARSTRHEYAHVNVAAHFPGEIDPTASFLRGLQFFTRRTKARARFFYRARPKAPLNFPIK